MQKIVLDSDVLIDFRNNGLHAEWVLDETRVKYFSAVVMMELDAGAIEADDEQWVGELYETAARAGRLVAPEARDYREAGFILRELRSQRGYEVRKLYRLSHDVLIALSAHRIGATLITRNRRDFEAIRRFRRFALQVIES